MVLFFIDLSTRKVEIGDIARIANVLWMNQIARNLTNPMEGILRGRRFGLGGRSDIVKGWRTQNMLSV